MDVSPVLVADLQAPEAVEPGERPFDHPAVASQAVLGLDTTAGDAGDDAALGGDGSRNPCRHGACAVGDGACRASWRGWARWRRRWRASSSNCARSRRSAHQDRERDAVGVDHKMALRALFAAIRWVLARFLAPPGPAP